MGTAYDWTREQAAPQRPRSTPTPIRRPRQMEMTVRLRRPVQAPPASAQPVQRSRQEPSPDRRPRKSARRKARKQKMQDRWGLALLSLMLAVIALGSAGRALSDASRFRPDSPPGTAALPPAGDGQRLALNNTGDVAVPDWVDQQLLPLNQFSRPGDALPQVNGVVVHYTGNPGTTAEQNRSYFATLAQTGETYASSHFVVGMDGAVVQCVPLNEIACCSTSRNKDTIAIECCHPDEEGQFTQETLDALTRLLNWLIETYGLGREDVIRHYDVAGKECPIYYVRHPEAWESLLDGLTFPEA